MKKLIYSAAAMALAFFAASCQQENLEPVASSNTVTYTVQVADAVATRAIGDDVTAVNELVYEVYRTEAEETTEFTNVDNLLYHKTAEVKNGVATIEIEFVNDQNFTVLFWAHTKDNGVYNVENLTNVTITSPDVANNVNAQAFVGRDFVRDCVSDQNGKVTLHRPVSQLNIATTPESLVFEAETGETGSTVVLEGSSVKVTGLATSYNIATLSAFGATATEYEYTETDVPTDVLPVNGKNYTYVAMNYVGFAPEMGTSDVTVSYVIYTSEGNIDNEILNVPVKPNYRTNIIGNLITSKTEYTITLEDKWYTPEEVVEIWDGQTITTPDYNVENKTWTVDNGAELAWIAHLVNGTLPATRAADSTPKYDKSQVIVLSKNINLGGYEWTPIGVGSKHFQGLFEGNGHIIENFQITQKNGGAQAAFFGTVSGDPTFRNVTIQGAKVVYPGEEAGDFYAAALIGTAYGNVTIQNVTVKNCKISGNNKVAGLLAHDGVMSSLNIDNCHILDCEIVSAHATDGGNVGGLVGLFQGVGKTASNAAPYGDHIIKNSSVKNTVINAVNSTNSGKRSNGEFVACIAGKANQTLVINNCEVEGNTFTQNEGVTYVSPYGVFVGGDRLDDRKATVIVDGKMMIDNGFTKEGNTFEVSNAAHFLAAANMLADGDVIKLLANVTFNANDRTDNSGWWDGLAYSGDKSFTIDLGGNTITQDGSLNDYLIWVKNDGAKANTITLKNGTMDAGKTAYSAFATASSNTQKITVNLENINLINDISNGAVVKARGGSVLNVNAGTVITGKNSYVGIEAVGNNTVVNVYDGAKIYQNGTSSYLGAIIGASYNATLNIYGGEGKSAKCGIIVMSTGATINVSGGEWTANGDGTVAGDNKGVLVSQNNRNESGWACKSILNVTGGTFKGGYNCYGMGPGVEADDAQINIKGGNFNANPANYVVAGYEATENAGIYTVAKPEALQALETALAKGGNVTLTNDVTLLESIKIENNVVLDLNGKTITAPLFSAFEVKAGGELTVKNGKVVAYESTVRAIGGKVIIESGEYTSTGTALDSPATYRYSLDCREGGELIINGGTFKSNNGMINVGSTVTINGGKFENVVEKTMTRHFAYVSAPLTINDGEFYGKANSSAGGCFFCGAAAGGDIQVNGGKFTSLWTSGSVNRIFEVYFGGTINVTGGMFNTNGGITSFVTANTDEATKAAYPYVAK